MGARVKALNAKLGILSSISRIHMVEKQNRLPQFPSDLDICISARGPTLVHMPENKLTWPTNQK